MSQGMNRITLIGNLGKDPELRHTQANRAVLNFRMATTETYVDKDDQKKENTQWHTCVIWGARAEGLAKYLHKGSRICVEGRMEYSEYDDKDGVKRYKSEVNVQNVILLDGAKPAEDSSDNRAHETTARAASSGKAPAKAPAKNSKGRDTESFASDEGEDQIPF